MAEYDAENDLTVEWLEYDTPGFSRVRVLKTNDPIETPIGYVYRVPTHHLIMALLPSVVNTIPAKGTHVRMWEHQADYAECDHGHTVNASVYHDGLFIFAIAVNNVMDHSCPTKEWMDALNYILAMDV